MLTPDERAAINRRNAKKSTGPRTEAGKKRSSLNAIRHNITGQIVVLPHEDMTAYHNHQESFFQFHQPVGPVETNFVQLIVDSTWQMHRSTAWETTIASQKSELINIRDSSQNRPEVNSALAIAAAISQCLVDLKNFSTYKGRHFSMYLKSLDQLETAQQKRKQTEHVALMEAERLKRLHEQEESDRAEAIEIEAGQAADQGQPTPPPYVKVPYSPTADGFVFSMDVLDAYLNRKARLEKARQVA